MKKLIILICCLLLVGFSIKDTNAQNIEKYSKVMIYAKTDWDFKKLANTGLFLDGGIRKPGYYFETWLSETEIEMLRNSGVPFDITIDDWDTYYSNLQRTNYIDPNISLTDEYNITHNIYGTMGGHLTWSHAISKLDSMRLEYPSLVSVKFSIGNSYEGRPLWTVRITKNPDAPTGRPEIWLNALTHAREPLGMSNLFYYIYWLLENYNIDPVATYILNNREIYFTPCLNPDGYVYNQTTNPNGGGNWRKNRQPYSTAIGTDLNRNFGTYNFWNSTNGGSSTSPSSDTYRGPYPFSTPEDSCFRIFVNSRNFKCQLDYHTYGNYLIKPWAWCDPIPTPDDAIFNEMGADITAVNHYTFGTPYQTVGYYVRGGDLDWVYSNDSTGHTYHIFAMTPEVGTTGFWPTQAEIIPLCKSCMHMNIYMTLAAGPYASLKTATFNKQIYTQNETGNLKVVFRNKGLMNASNVKVQFTPLSSYVTIPVQEYFKASLPSRTSDSTTFNFTISNSCPNNFGIPTRLRILQNDTVVLFNQVYYLLIGNGVAMFQDSAENGFGNWTTSNTWGIVSTQYHSPSNSFTDSPSGNYGNNANNSMTLNLPLNTQNSPVVYLSFWHKYYTEAGYDFCRVEVSSNNGASWTEVTSYDGNMQTWTYQSFDISSYCNSSPTVKIRFRLTSDSYLTYDGWYVDDIKITGYQSVITGIENGNLSPYEFSLEQNYPNPFNPITQINYSIPEKGFVKLVVYDLLGREVATLVNEIKDAGKHTLSYDASMLSSGVYFYTLQVNGMTETRKMTLIR